MNFEGILGLIQKYLFRFSLSRIGITDIVEIIIISVIVYQIIKWLQLTRAWTLFKGIIVLLLFALAAVIFQLDTIAWLLSNSLSVGIMAAIVIFQPELRRALEQLGRKNFFRTFIFSSEDEGTEKTFLTEKAVTVIIRGSRVVSATCYLPLTDSMELGKELGTRHRAAVGISEVSDSTTIVVSEETGAVSVAREGRLSRNLTRDELKERLNLLRPESTGSMDVLKKWKGLLRNERPEKPAKNKEQ